MPRVDDWEVKHQAHLSNVEMRKKWVSRQLQTLGSSLQHNCCMICQEPESIVFLRHDVCAQLEVVFFGDSITEDMHDSETVKNYYQPNYNTAAYGIGGACQPGT